MSNPKPPPIACGVCGHVTHVYKMSDNIERVAIHDGLATMSRCAGSTEPVTLNQQRAGVRMKSLSELFPTMTEDELVQFSFQHNAEITRRLNLAFEDIACSIRSRDLRDAEFARRLSAAQK